MAYLILADHNGEFDRRELRVPMVIGRAADCDLCIRDILLSRHHCRIEPFDNRWVVTDLNSKNHTRIGSEIITRHVLRDGDAVRIGKIQICFKAGAFIPRPGGPRDLHVRPTDPIEALAGTISGFQFFDMEEDSRQSGFPIPRPRPAQPLSGHDMVSDIASTVWDVILSEPDMVSRPVRKKKSRIPAIRQESPTGPAPIPAWLAKTYVGLVCVIAVISLSVILIRSLL